MGIDGAGTLDDFNADGTSAGHTDLSASGAQQFNAAGKAVPNPAVCTSLINFFSNFTVCVGRSISVVIGTALVYVASWVLTVAGLLFNWVLTETVLQFGQLINSNVIAGINTAWTAFRDISNIVIIGMFTFIAISTILGSHDYGAKKMISRVLIVAILINFSLLFTEIIIDASNFTAVQFNTAASSVLPQTSSAGNAGTCNTTGATGCTAQSSGIAGAFLGYAGASTLGGSLSAVNKIAQDPAQGGWIALLFGIVVSIMELAAALVLFYGAFLLISRALLMVFLMITSSIAFATYLIPSLSSGYGWSAWWSSLLKNAIFAPLLMVFLWVTLTIAQAFQKGIGTNAGSLGDLIANPTKTIDINALLGYILVIGLLFISFKLASSFATQIGGFNFATALAGSPLSLGSRLAAPVLRGSLGRFGAWRQEGLEKQRDNAKASGDEALARRLNTKLDRSKRFGVATLATKDFNAMNTGLGKAFAKQAGLGGMLSGEKKVGGFKKTAEAKAKEGVEVAKGLVLSDDDKKKIRGEAEKNFTESKSADTKALEKLQEIARENVDATRESVAQGKDQLEQDHRDAQMLVEAHKENGTRTEETYDKQIKQLGQELQRAAGTADATKINDQIRGIKEQRDSEMREQGRNIEQAKAQVERIQSKIAAGNASIAEAQKAYESAGAAVKNFTTKLDKDAQAHGKHEADKAEARFMNTASDVAASRAQRRVSNLPYALSPGDDYTARLARKSLKKDQKSKHLKERLAAWRALDKEEGGGEHAEHKEDTKDDAHK
jgi:hypothetical protein